MMAGMKSDVELISKAEAVLDRTLAYQAAHAIHELKANLGIAWCAPSSA
jgi:hypothetical protein